MLLQVGTASFLLLACFVTWEVPFLCHDICKVLLRSQFHITPVGEVSEFCLGSIQILDIETKHVRERNFVSIGYAHSSTIDDQKESRV